MKKLILTLSILLITIISYGQHQTISVNGIELDKHYTQSQIYNILGTPKSIEPNEDAPWCAYKYNNSYFSFKYDDYVLINGIIKDTTYKVNNYLTVGMHSDSINAMKGYLTPEKNADEDSSFLYWAPSKDYRDNVAYIQIWVNRKTRKIEMISLLSQEMLCFY